jgi:hypothetical protein
MSPDPYHGRGEPLELTASGFPTLAGVLIPSARGGSQFNACREKKLRPGLEPRRRSKEKHEPESQSVKAVVDANAHASEQSRGKRLAELVAFDTRNPGGDERAWPKSLRAT